MRAEQVYELLHFETRLFTLLCVVSDVVGWLASKQKHEAPDKGCMVREPLSFKRNKSLADAWRKLDKRNDRSTQNTNILLILKRVGEPGLMWAGMITSTSIRSSDNMFQIFSKGLDKYNSIAPQMKEGSRREIIVELLGVRLKSEKNRASESSGSSRRDFQHAVSCP